MGNWSEKNLNFINMLEIKVSDFTTTPWPRYKKQWTYSGEEFYDKILISAFEKWDEKSPIIINLDGTRWYPSSFLSESFGRLYQKLGSEEKWKKIKFISEDDPYHVDFINRQVVKYGQ